MAAPDVRVSGRERDAVFGDLPAPLLGVDDH